MRTAVIVFVCSALVAGAVAVVIGVFVALSRQESSIFELEAGDCFVLPEFDDDESRPTTALDTVDSIDCDEPHNAEVLTTGQVNRDQSRPHPGDDALLAEVWQLCRPAGRAADDLGFGVLPVIPNEAAWEPRGGPYLCIAVAYGGTLGRGSIAERVAASVAGT